MKTHTAAKRGGDRAFSLIEMLVVIAIIGLLAAMIIPLSAYLSGKARVNMAMAEMGNVETALASYKVKRGTYPPDNPANPAVNMLFYELTGTTYSSPPNAPATSFIFQRLHGGENVSRAMLQAIFGLGVGGFVNSSFVVNPKDNAQLQEAEVRDFFTQLKPKEYLEISTTGQPTGPVLAVLGLQGVDGPLMLTSPTTGNRINPWRYNSSNPTNNPGAYDLWIDVTVGGKIKRICNWSREPLSLN
jgi:prepilin-type N-terminal cleavage/methylation domain-containing protein